MAVKISVFYATPESGDGHFDLEYYTNTHVPMVWDLLAKRGLRSIEVEKGLAGGAPGAPAPYAAVGHMAWDSLDDFQKAFAAVGKEIEADIPNYTNVKPVVQVSEVVVARP
jgi:uncharacterized protein (TIGR02118 family)